MDYFLQSQKFAYTKVTMLFNSLGKVGWWCHGFGRFWFWLIDNIWINWRQICGCTLRHTSNTLLPCVTSWENQKKSAIDVRKKIVDLHESGSSLGTISRCLKVSCLSVPTITNQYNHNGNVQPSYYSVRRQVLCPRDECWFGEMCVSIPEQKPNTLWRCWLKLVRVSSSTVKPVLYQHGLKGHLVRKKSLLQKQHIKARLQFTNEHRDKDLIFWRHVLWSDETKIELFGHNDHRYIWRKKGEACKSENVIPTVKYGSGSIMLWGAFSCRRDWCTLQYRWHR